MPFLGERLIYCLYWIRTPHLPARGLVVVVEENRYFFLFMCMNKCVKNGLLLLADWQYQLLLADWQYQLLLNKQARG
jgi:hypothetical protein